MTRVLLTGGSGFIAAHVLDLLLKRGHSVVTTVRSQAKADNIKKAYPDMPKDKLDFAIVEDIAQENAFDQAVVSNPPFESIIHTASPFRYNITDVKKDLLDPAVIGTTGVLAAAKNYAPTVKRIVITSSFAAILDVARFADGEHVWSEKDWNPVTPEQAMENGNSGYRASKTFAEKAAWEFVKSEQPNFTISTINPPIVLGPIVHYLNSLDALNTSNQRTREFLLGNYKTEIADTGNYYWVDVRDVALAHVNAMERPEAVSKRFFVTAGNYCNKEIGEIIRKNFPEYADKLPPADVESGGYPSYSIPGYDNSRSKAVLGLEYRTLDEAIVDTVNSLKAVGA